MGRNRQELTAAEEAHLMALMTKGETVARATASLKAMGAKTSTATVARRMRELASKVREARVSVVPPPASVPDLPESEEEIPEGIDLGTYDRWIAKAETMAKQAELDKNLVELGKAGRLVVMLLDAKRKATPPAPPDPNERPDMIAAAQRARDALHKLVDSAVGK